MSSWVGATEKQKAYLLYLMDQRGMSQDEVDVLKLSLHEASNMIHGLLEEETRIELPAHWVFRGCPRCGVRTWEARPVSGSACWNCGAA